jgi:hypothetical protein
MDVKGKPVTLAANAGVVYRGINAWLDRYPWMFLVAFVVPYISGRSYWLPYQVLSWVWLPVMAWRLNRLRRSGRASRRDWWWLVAFPLYAFWPIPEMIYRLTAKKRVAATRAEATAHVTAITLEPPASGQLTPPAADGSDPSALP